MDHKSVDILGVIVITVVAVVLVFTVAPDNLAGRILVLPLVLILPGYALTSALFPKRSLGIPERLVFSVGLSLMIVVLGGLVLNMTSYGLQTNSWVIFLSSITVSTSVVTLVRRRGNGVSRSSWPIIGLSLRSSLLLSMATIIVIGAIAVSGIGAKQQQYNEGFTQVWILPMKGTGQTYIVRLGVSNMQIAEVKYKLNVSVNGKIVQAWPNIDLKSHRTWETNLVLPLADHTSSVHVEAMLYRSSAPSERYRYVELWLGP